MSERRVIACTVHTASEADTARFGAELGECIEHGTCVSLVGPLGAGKTVLVGGLCRGLGIDEERRQPPFGLLETSTEDCPLCTLICTGSSTSASSKSWACLTSTAHGAVLLAEWATARHDCTTLQDVEIRIEGAG
jgi:tRNA A37 threonylcarbamoyladenosine biosynthesis protein TsaE